MALLIAASGASTWLLLIGAGIAGVAFGMLINTRVHGRDKKKK